MSERTATTEVRQEGFYWVILGQNPPETPTGSAGNGGLAGEPRAVTVVSERLVFKPRLAPVA
jgi:hypothetical protein